MDGIKKRNYIVIIIIVIIFSLSLPIIGIVAALENTNNPMNYSSIPIIKIGWEKYYDYGKYIDKESLKKIGFGDVLDSEMYTSKGTPVYSGRAWFYYNKNNAKKQWKS